MGKITFLVVDDSHVWRKIIRKFIEERICGKVIAEANDGYEAIKLYKKFKPDIVTMDIEMPNLDGIKALEEILNFDKCAKVIVISSKGEEDIVRKALLVGAQDFIIKDLEVEKWTKKFEKVIKEIEKTEKKTKGSLFHVVIRCINKFKNK